MSLISKMIDLENPVLRGYVTYGSVLVLKMMIMTPLTAVQRKRHAVAEFPEDSFWLKGRNIVQTHPDVDRVRRAHRNDLESIPIFFVAGLAYVLTDPDPCTALTLFRTYTICRCAHTVVYAIYVVPQPARAICFFTGYLITGYMALKAISNFKAF